MKHNTEEYFRYDNPISKDKTQSKNNTQGAFLSDWNLLQSIYDCSSYVGINNILKNNVKSNK